MRLFTEQHQVFVKEHYLLSRGQLADELNKTFGVNFTPEQVGTLRKRLRLFTGRSGHFAKGSISWNSGKTGIHSGSSTSFKKGNRPHNAVPVGTEVVTTDGYVKVKIAEPKLWAFKHRLIWEKAHGKIPNGKVLVFKDDDKTNVTLDNLELLNRWELVRLNKNRASEAPTELKPAVKTIIRIEARRFKLQKGDQTNAAN